MGFDLEARPQHLVSQHVYEVFCKHEDWYREMWSAMHDKPPKHDSYWDYAEEILNCAGPGTLLE
eukprot:7932017-Prorocentrum_lima.AAC.1